MFDRDRTVYVRAFEAEGQVGVRLTKKAPNDFRDSDELVRGELKLGRPIGFGPWKRFNLELEKDVSPELLRGIKTLAKISVEFGIYDSRR